MNKSQIWVVVPAYNEASHISNVLKRLQAITKNVAIVDDGSTDETYKIASKYGYPLTRHRLNLGKGAAMRTGAKLVFERFGGQAVIFFDADEQHVASEIEGFQNRLIKGAKVVLGVRSFDANMPVFRIILNRLTSVLTFLLFGVYIPDIPSGFKAFTKDSFKKLIWQSNDYAVELEIAARLAKYKIPFEVQPISTVYLGYDRGMTFLHALNMVARFIGWRFSL